MSMHAVVGSMILMKMRRTTEVLPPSWRKLWKEWELRVMVLLSLTTQVVLVILGKQRKHISGIWIRVTLWSAYLLADSVAAMAAGILSNDLGDMYNSGFVDAKSEITAFWAPMMLVHLGGTDAITAYSLEDNELWKRHSFGVVIQAMTTMYIFFLAWTGSRLSILFILMFIVGLFKYCERVFVLYFSSDVNFRESIKVPTNNESNVMKECKLKELEGHYVTTHQVLEIDHYSIPNHPDQNHNTNELLLIANQFLNMVKRLFADLILGKRDEYASISVFKELKPDEAVKIVEIELGLIYDLRYTKAKVVYSSLGITLKTIGFIMTLIVLAMVSLDETTLVRVIHHHHDGLRHSKIDLTITLVLLVFALLVDLWAFMQLLRSDQAAHWLIKYKKTTILRAIEPILQRHVSSTIERRRWSNSIHQLSLLNFSLRSRENPLHCRPILKKLHIDKILEIELYKSAPVSLNNIRLGERIFEEIKGSIREWEDKHGGNADLKTLYGRKGCRSLENVNFYNDLKWSIEDLEFDQSILVWHLATEILYYHQGCDHKTSEPEEGKPGPQTSTYLSQYMLYLLVKHPSMLPLGMASIKFQGIYVDLSEIIEEQLKDDDSKNNVESKEKRACDKLLSLKGENAEKLVTNYKNKKLGRSNFLILHGCRLASQIKSKIEERDRWGVIGSVWMEMLGHAASQCRGRPHAQQLRKGGEFLTHVWLLMAHFGMNDLFQIPRSSVIADAVRR